MAEQKHTDFDFSTISQMLEKSCEINKSKTCFKFFGSDGKIQKISYGDFFKDVRALSFSLNNELNLKGKTIALCMNNSYFWCLSYFSICFCGAICVPLDKDLSQTEISNLLSFSNADAIITEEKIGHGLILENEANKEKIKIITSEISQNESFISLSSLLQDGKTLFENETQNEKDSQETAIILFTSGTTAVAKGVMLSNENICSDIKSVSNIISFAQEDSTLCVLPLHHAYQAIVMLIMISVGGCVCFSRGLRYILPDLKAFSPTVFVTVPVMLEKMHKKITNEISQKSLVTKTVLKTAAHSFLKKSPQDELKTKLFGSVHELFGGKMRYIITGAAALNSTIAKDFYSFGLPVIIGYGLTECSPIVICNSENDLSFDSIGKPVINAEARIENPNEDGIGEICVKGPMVMHGYYKNKEETDKVLKDGWLHTGDLGFKDKNGNYHITGRSKNVIVSKNGKNIYPEEIEYYLSRQPFISECLVFASGENEDVCATVRADAEEIKRKMKTDSLTDEQTQKAVLQAVKKTNAILQSYKRIRKVFLKDEEFEKTASSKIKRNCEENKNAKQIL